VNHICAFNEWGKCIIDAFKHYPDGSSVHAKMIPKLTSSREEWEYIINELADRILLDRYFEMQDTCLFIPFAIRMPVNTDFDYFSNSKFDNFSNSILDNLGNKVVYSENAIEDLKRLCLQFVNITSATNISSSSSSSSSSSNPEVNINKRKLSNDGENSIHSDKKSKIAADVDKLLVNTSTPKMNNNNSPANISSAVTFGSKERKGKWTAREEDAFKSGVKKHGIGNWKPILDDPEFKLALISRSNVNLKDKFKTMQNQFLKKYEEDDDDHGDEFTRLLINHYENKQLSELENFY